MKKLLIGLFLFISTIVSYAHSSIVTYDKYLLNESALAVSTIVTLNLNGNGITPNTDSISFQATYSSVSIAGQQFSDGHISAGDFIVKSLSVLTTSYATNKITVSTSTNFFATKATNYITVYSTNNLSGAYIDVVGSNGKPIRLTENVNWFRSSFSSVTANSIATVLNTIPGIRASASNNVVYATASVSGVSGNSYSIVSSDSQGLIVFSKNFTGGKLPAFQNAFININGTILKQGSQWYATDTASGTAKSISQVLNIISGVNASYASNIIYTTASVVGSAGNLYTLSSSSQEILNVETPTYSGGEDNTIIGINGIFITQGVDWFVQATASGTAESIFNAFTTNPQISSIVRSTWTGGSIISIYSRENGTASNYPLYSSNLYGITISDNFMKGGQSSAYVINTPTITIKNNGFCNGLGVIYNADTVTISPLIDGSLYFVGKIDENNFYLSDTSTGALSGKFITLLSSTTFGNNTFTLTPQVFSGTPTLKWQASNDGIDWFDLPVFSVTYSVPSTSYWDGFTSFKYIRSVITAPSTGAWSMKIYGYGRNQ